MLPGACGSGEAWEVSRGVSQHNACGWVVMNEIMIFSPLSSLYKLPG